MAGEWKKVQLQNIVSKLGDGIHGTPEYSETGSHFFINGNNLDNGRILLKNDTKRVSFSEYAKYKKILNNRTLLVSINGTIGNVACYNNEPVILGKSACYFNLHEDVDRRFIRYVLSSSAFLHYLESYSTGTTIKNVSLKMMREFSFWLPTLPEQKRIAHILGTLDDKIELNRRMNATLEGMAQALFQSWFIDFDPVRAKLDGRQPVGIDPATAALFPDSFQDSVAGYIPQGWEVKTLSELTKLITKGTTPTQSDMTGAPESDSQIFFVRVNSLEEDGSILANKLTTIPESVHKGVLKRSVLMANDVLYTIAGTIGRIALAEEWMLPANTNQAVAIIRPELDIPSRFLVMTMRHEDFREELHNNIVHAVQANLSLGMLSKARVVLPPRINLHQLFKPIDALLSQVSVNRNQSRTLAALRDMLLPKLLSGELTINGN